MRADAELSIVYLHLLQLDIFPEAKPAGLKKRWLVKRLHRWLASAHA